ncbi:MAG: hypothetical protein DRP78_05030 [Candidatus Omnitrophota bacterium]|nr:MAG: hypothetical protein DRP78_05030 [Candidatus Omnitrophota bacterium]
MENSAKIISVMKPVPFNAGNFDLAIIPAHDRVKSSGNILITKGALNLIDSEYIARSVREFKENIKIKQGLKIGLLIGGNSTDYLLSAKVMENVLGQVKKFLVEFNAELLISTSRRTPKDVEQYLDKALAQYQRCIFKVFANQFNPEFAVGAILGLCDVVITSGESISMVSETASSGAYTIVFLPKKRRKNKKSKHRLFLEDLQKTGIIRMSSPDAIYHSLMDFKNKQYQLKQLDNQSALDQAIRNKILLLNK